MKKLVALTAVLAMAGPLAVLSPASADAATVKTYKNCTALHKVYKNGVGKKGAKDKTSGKPDTSFKVSAALYKANEKLDGDKDGIACEVYKAKPVRLLVGNGTAKYGDVTFWVNGPKQTAISDVSAGDDNHIGNGETYSVVIQNHSAYTYDPVFMTVGVTYGAHGVIANQVFDDNDASGELGSNPIPGGSAETVKFEFAIPANATGSVVISLSPEFGYPASFFYGS